MNEVDVIAISVPGVGLSCTRWACQTGPRPSGRRTPCSNGPSVRSAGKTAG